MSLSAPLCILFSLSLLLSFFLSPFLPISYPLPHSLSLLLHLFSSLFFSPPPLSLSLTLFLSFFFLSVYLSHRVVFRLFIHNIICQTLNLYQSSYPSINQPPMYILDIQLVINLSETPSICQPIICSRLS